MRKDQIFLLACLGYIAGVFAGSFFVFSWWIFFLGAGLLIACTVVFFQKKTLYFIVPVLLIAFGVFSAEQALKQYSEARLQPGEASGTVRVVNDPEDKSFYKHVVVKFVVCDDSRCPQERILWQAPLATDVLAGTALRFSCPLELPKNFDPEFDYRMFLAKDGIAYVCAKASKAEILPPDRWARFMRGLFLPKRALESAIEKSIPQPEAGLALGLIIGGDNRLPEDLQDGFVTAGLSHIVAISGYNIALIAQGFVILGIMIGLWRRQALWFAIVGIILFIVLVGAPASAVRAGVMGSALFVALFVGRQSRGMNMLLLAGAVMLMFQPLLLRYDIGFQLSFLATLAIVVTAPLIHQLMPKEFFGKGIVEIALLTFSVELFVVPLIVYHFHIFSVFALFMNVLILPFVPYAMATVFVSALGFFLIPGFHVLPAWIAYAILRSITYAVEQLNVVSKATIEMSLHPIGLFFWYGFLFLVVFLIRKYYTRRYVQEKDIQ